MWNDFSDNDAATWWEKLFSFQLNTVPIWTCRPWFRVLSAEWGRVRDLTLHQSSAVFVPVSVGLVGLSRNRKFGVRTSLLDNRYLCFVRVRAERQQLESTGFITKGLMLVWELCRILVQNHNRSHVKSADILRPATPQQLLVNVWWHAVVTEQPKSKLWQKTLNYPSSWLQLLGTSQVIANRKKIKDLSNHWNSTRINKQNGTGI